MKSIIKIAFFFLISVSLKAQIAINFTPAIYGQTIEGLSFVQLINSSGLPTRITVTIRVKQNAGSVLVVKTPVVILQSGINTINRKIFSESSLLFGNSIYADQLKQTGKFPEGEYEYCYEVAVLNDKNISTGEVYESCFDYNIQPLTPLILINPVDEDEMCNVRPNLIWQPPIPMVNNARFRVILTEIVPKQSPSEAISYNIPIINQSNIVGSTLFYPPNAPDLLKEKKYVWQVTVYTGKTILSKSEIWSFQIKCGDEKLNIEADSYREIKEYQDGGFYIANQILRFSFNNYYQSQKLNYSIGDLENPTENIKNLPPLTAETGINKYNIDLSEMRSFKEGRQYILKVKTADNKELQLRFIYQASK